MIQKTIDEIIADHEARNAALRDLFRDKNIDIQMPRIIECHFWTWNEGDTANLAEDLKTRGFTLMVQRLAETAGDSTRWNLEVSIQQSIDLTMRREFIDDLVQLAAAHNGLYDGWGTRV